MKQEPIIDQATEFVEDALDRAKEGLGSLPRKVRKMGNLNLNLDAEAKRLADAVGPTWKAVRKQMRQKPGIAVCVGALLGLTIGFLVRGRD